MRCLIAVLVLAVLLAVPRPAQAQQAVPPPVDYGAVAYTLRHLSPTTLIEIAFAEFGPAVVERFKVLACREGGVAKGSGRTWQIACSPSHRIEPAPPMSCGADNPRSSASGAFQYMASWAGYGGFDWSQIVGPDCYEDVMMTVAVYRACGFGPWE